MNTETKEEKNSMVFTGKKKTSITIDYNTITLRTSKETVVAPLRSVAGLFCEKKGKHYLIRVSSRCDVDVPSLKLQKRAVYLSAGDTSKLITIFKNFVG